jgi:hypothetical protein
MMTTNSVLSFIRYRTGDDYSHRQLVQQWRIGARAVDRWTFSSRRIVYASDYFDNNVRVRLILFSVTVLRFAYR